MDMRTSTRENTNAPMSQKAKNPNIAMVKLFKVSCSLVDLYKFPRNSNSLSRFGSSESLSSSSWRSFRRLSSTIRMLLRNPLRKVMHEHTDKGCNLHYADEKKWKQYDSSRRPCWSEIAKSDGKEGDNSEVDSL